MLKENQDKYNKLLSKIKKQTNKTLDLEKRIRQSIMELNEIISDGGFDINEVELSEHLDLPLDFYTTLKNISPDKNILDGLRFNAADYNPVLYYGELIRSMCEHTSIRYTDDEMREIMETLSTLIHFFGKDVIYSEYNPLKMAECIFCDSVPTIQYQNHVVLLSEDGTTQRIRKYQEFPTDAIPVPVCNSCLSKNGFKKKGKGKHPSIHRLIINNIDKDKLSKRYIDIINKWSLLTNV